MTIGAIITAVYWYRIIRAYGLAPITLASSCGSAISSCSGASSGSPPNGSSRSR